jgi:RNA polymerase sigma factor (sigma-70 family)
MEEGPTDAQVIEASLGDAEAFGEIFDRHFPEISRYLERRVGPAGREDLAAEAFSIAFRKRGGYDLARGDCRPWLFGIAANLIRNHRRSERRQLRAYMTMGAELDLADEFAEAESRIEAHARAPEIFEALASIGRRERELILLFAWAELSYGEIAEALSIPVGTVKSGISRARNQVQSKIQSATPRADEDGDEAVLTPRRKS